MPRMVPPMQNPMQPGMMIPPQVYGPYITPYPMAQHPPGPHSQNTSQTNLGQTMGSPNKTQQ